MRTMPPKIVPIGFLIEVSLFVTSGWLFGRAYYIIGTLVLFLGLVVALFVGELIRRNSNFVKPHSSF